MTNKKVTVSDIRNDFPETKRQNEYQSHLWSYLVIRRLTFYVTPFFINRGISANAVTFLSLIALLGAYLSILSIGESNVLMIVGAVLVNVWYFLDRVDGNVARYNDADSKFGAFFDWYVGIIYHAGLPLCVGIGIYLYEGHTFITIDPVWWVLLATVWTIALFLRKLTAQKATILSEPTDSARDLNKLEMAAGAYTSFRPPLFLLFSLLGAVDIWMLLYAVYNVIAVPVQLAMHMSALR